MSPTRGGTTSWMTLFEKWRRRYLANGEIGLVVGQFKGRSWKPKGLPWKIEVEFSSQLGLEVWLRRLSDFGDEGEAPLELAYALTIHKAQGSEFGTTFIVIPNPCRLLSRELLYTALTRQREQVVLFHQGDLGALRKAALIRALGDRPSADKSVFRSRAGRACRGSSSKTASFTARPAGSSSAQNRR